MHADVAAVQDWLQQAKYDIHNVDTSQENFAAESVLGRVGVRYDTTEWVDFETTPRLVADIIAMLTASFVLRKAVSQDEGLAGYADWLEIRAMQLAEDIATGVVSLPGIEVDQARVTAGALAFFPTDQATEAAELDPTDPNGAPRAFTMGQVF